VPPEAIMGEAVEERKEESTQPQRKRMSLFRSRSSQGKPSPKLELEKGVETEFAEPSPVEQSIHRWSRMQRPNGAPATFERVAEGQSYEPAPAM